MVIGIEGHTGAGKTSICRELLNMIPNGVLLNGGNWYRALIYAMLSSGKTIEELSEITNGMDITTFMDDFGIELKIENNETVPYIKGVRCNEEELQNKQSSLAVSTVGGKANNKKLFEIAHSLIDDLKEKYNVIISGRSLNLIYPEMDHHIFVVASLEERVKRKYTQYKGEESIESIRENLIQRDKFHEESGFYKTFENTTILDVTDCKSAKESAELLLKTINY